MCELAASGHVVMRHCSRMSLLGIVLAEVGNIRGYPNHGILQGLAL